MRSFLTSGLGRGIRRRAWIVVVCLILAGAAASALADRGETTHTAQATLFVSPGAGANGGPGDASQARTLAVIYAGALGKDDRIVAAVSRVVRVSADEVEERLAVSNVQDTSLVTIAYVSNSAVESRRAVATIVDGVVGRRPVTPTVSAGTLQVTQALTSTSEEPNGSAVPVALMLGLLVGLVLAVATDRADPRADSPADIRHLLPCPVTLVGRDAPTAVSALLPRWSATSSGPVDGIEFVPVLRSSKALAQALRAQLRLERKLEVEPVGRSLEEQVDGHLEPTSGSIVLLVRQGDRVHALERALGDLEVLDRVPVWCLLVPAALARRGKSARSTAPVTAARSSELPNEGGAAA